MIDTTSTFTLSREEADTALMLNRDVLEVSYNDGSVVYFEETPDGFTDLYCDQGYLVELLAW